MTEKTRDDRERAVVVIIGGVVVSSPMTVQVYLGWIRRFRKHCHQSKSDEVQGYSTTVP